MAEEFNGKTFVESLKGDAKHDTKLGMVGGGNNNA